MILWVLRPVWSSPSWSFPSPLAPPDIRLSLNTSAFHRFQIVNSAHLLPSVLFGSLFSYNTYNKGFLLVTFWNFCTSPPSFRIFFYLLLIEFDFSFSIPGSCLRGLHFEGWISLVTSSLDLSCPHLCLRVFLCPFFAEIVRFSSSSGWSQQGRKLSLISCYGLDDCFLWHFVGDESFFSA